MKKNLLKSTSLILIFSLALFSCKKKEETIEVNIEDPVSTTKYALIIENGALSISPNESVTYSAILIDENGSITVPTGITWTVAEDSVATISSSGVLNTAGTGNTTISASVSVDGVSYSASVPIGVYLPSLFTVAPSAIIYEKGGSLQLEVVNFTTETGITYSFSSSNTAVASVSGSGLVSFIGAGECLISIEASNLSGQPFIVPVLVISAPDIPLPVTRIELNKSAVDLFKNETAQITPTAYNADGVVNNAVFTYSSLNPSIATVNSSGLITPVKTGKTYVQVSAEGIIAQCEVLVNPDTVVIIAPFFKNLSAGDTQQFTATAYKNERGVDLTTATTYPVTFSWIIPDYGPGFEMFNIGNVDNTGLVTIKNDAMIGMSSFVIAYDQNNQHVGGAAMIMIEYDIPWPTQN